MKTSSVFFLLLVVFNAFVFAVPKELKSKTRKHYDVCSSGDSDFSTLESAVAAATSAVELRLCAGVYTLASAVTISVDGITISGDRKGDTQIDGQIYVTGDRVTLRKLQFKSSRTFSLDVGEINDFSGNAALINVYADNFAIVESDIVLTGTQNGIKFNGDGLRVHRNTFTETAADAKHVGVFIGGVTSAGSPVSSSHIDVSDNEFVIDNAFKVVTSATVSDIRFVNNDVTQTSDNNAFQFRSVLIGSLAGAGTVTDVFISNNYFESSSSDGPWTLFAKGNPSYALTMNNVVLDGNSVNYQAASGSRFIAISNTVTFNGLQVTNNGVWSQGAIFDITRDVVVNDAQIGHNTFVIYTSNGVFHTDSTGNGIAFDDLKVLMNRIWMSESASIFEGSQLKLTLTGDLTIQNDVQPTNPI